MMIGTGAWTALLRLSRLRPQHRKVQEFTLKGGWEGLSTRRESLFACCSVTQAGLLIFGAPGPGLLDLLLGVLSYVAALCRLALPRVALCCLVSHYPAALCCLVSRRGATVSRHVTLRCSFLYHTASSRILHIQLLGYWYVYVYVCIYIYIYTYTHTYTETCL